MAGKSKKNEVTLSNGKTITVNRMSTGRYMLQHRWLYFMLIPGALYFILFRYIPMGGLIIAFKEYSPFKGYGIVHG